MTMKTNFKELIINEKVKVKLGEHFLYLQGDPFQPK